MNALVAFERSGIVREAFRSRGHNAWSADLEEAEDGSAFHIKGWIGVFGGWPDNHPWRFFDLLIAHPPCTYLSVSGLHWNKRRPHRAQETEKALRLVAHILAAPIKRKAIENPISCISTRIRKPDQIIQPWQFGEDASKATCLWLDGLPPLRPTSFVEPRVVNGKRRWANQTDSGQNRLGPSPIRAAERARTYRGIAAAMADQWGGLEKDCGKYGASACSATESLKLESLAEKD